MTPNVNSNRPITLRHFQIGGEFVLVCPQLPDWRCTGATRQEVMANCAGSLRDYLKHNGSLTPYQICLIGRALEARSVTMSWAPSTEVA